MYRVLPQLGVLTADHCLVWHTRMPNYFLSYPFLVRVYIPALLVLVHPAVPSTGLFVCLLGQFGAHSPVPCPFVCLFVS